MNLVRVNTALQTLCNPFCITVHLCENKSTYTAMVRISVKALTKEIKKIFFFNFQFPIIFLTFILDEF